MFWYTYLMNGLITHVYSNCDHRHGKLLKSRDYDSEDDL